MSRRLHQFRCQFCEASYYSQKDLNAHCDKHSHWLNPNRCERSCRGVEMEYLLSVLKEKETKSLETMNHLHKKPSELVSHPLIAVYHRNLAEKESTTLSSASSALLVSSASGDKDSYKRKREDEIVRLLDQFKVKYCSDSEDNYWLYLFATLEHSNPEATLIVCLLSGTSNHEYFPLCRDKSHSYHSSFKFHKGNFLKHITSQHPVCILSCIVVANFCSQFLHQEFHAKCVALTKENCLILAKEVQTEAKAKDLVGTICKKHFQRLKSTVDSLSKSSRNVSAASVQRKITHLSFYSLSEEQCARRMLHECLFFAESGSPFHYLDLKSFHEWMAELKQPKISRKFASGELLDTVYQAACLSIMSQMEIRDPKSKTILSKCSSFSITFDLWTDVGFQNNFLALTRHFIPDDEWMLKSIVVDIIPFNKKHTADNIAHEVACRLQNVSSLLYCGVTDNGANVKKALNLILNDIVDGEGSTVNIVEDDFEEVGFRCQDHTLDLVIQKAIETIEICSKDIQNIQNIVIAIRSSTLRQQKLMEIQKTLNADPLSLKQDIKTRWNSIYFMLERYAKLEGAISIFISLGDFDDLDLEIPDNNAKERIYNYVKILQPFEVVSRFLEGESYCTLPHLPFFVKFLLDFLQIEKQELEIMKQLRKNLFLGVQTRFGYILEKVNESLLAAAVHPVHGHLNFISTSLKKDVIQKMKDWASVLYEPNELQHLGDEATEEELFGESDLSYRNQQIERLLYRFSQEKHQENWGAHILENDKGEFSFIFPKTSWEMFYKNDMETNQSFARIYLLVKMFISLPATSAPSERVFSCTGHLKPISRFNLSPETLEKLAIIRCHIHSPLYSFENFFQHFQSIINLG